MNRMRAARKQCVPAHDCLAVWLFLQHLKHSQQAWRGYRVRFSIWPTNLRPSYRIHVFDIC